MRWIENLMLAVLVLLAIVGVICGGMFAWRDVMYVLGVLGLA